MDQALTIEPFNRLQEARQSKSSSDDSKRAPSVRVELLEFKHAPSSSGVQSQGLPSTSSSSKAVVPYQGPPVSQAILLFLKAQKKIRVYVEASLNFGHQTNTFNILYTLRSIGYQGAFQIIVAEADTVDELKGLFPWIAEDTGIQLVGRSDFDRYEEVVPLCLTGGFDNNDEQALEVPPLEMGVNCFLALQPYKFEVLSITSKSKLYLLPTEALDAMPDVDAMTTYDFCKKEPKFLEMGYLPPFVPDTFLECQQLLAKSAQGWETVQVPQDSSEEDKRRAGWPRRVQSHLCLFSVLFSGDYLVAGAYGLMRNFSLKADSSAEILFHYASALALCTLKKPAVIVVFHDTINTAKLCLALEKNPLKNVFVQQMPSLPSEQLVRGMLDGVFKDTGIEVLILVVGRTPQLLFNFCFKHAELPCIFEGEGSVPLAFSRGRPFLYMKGPGAKTESSFYPTLGGKYPVLSASIQKVANLLHSSGMDSQLTLPKLFKFFQMALDEHSSLCDYFRLVAEFYADPDNNRLFQALARAIQALKKLD
ncbi:hypothetical protein JYK02_25430 [Corallococcus macrosporus]|uniref:Uncharacterized protein n=1 Tax=Corallococcus macrosporus TaxID=35 RepID=A0ABS3DHR4_9BACT|nr:hypothetical protein [Corallococcus macrosporus]MBN8230863.1 hypothetical protein [Corallococcus macrosporus]